MTSSTVEPRSNTKNKKTIKKGYWVILGLVIAVLLFVFVGLPIINARKQAAVAASLQLATIARGSLTATVGATGTVHAEQTAILTWQTSGTVGMLNLQAGDQVKAGDVLASLSQTSLSQNLVLAQSDLVTAQHNLDNLVNSGTASAQAQLNLVNAQKSFNSANATLISMQAKQHGGTTADIQNAQAHLTLAQNAVDQAQSAYNLVKDRADTDTLKAQAYTALYNAKQSLISAQNNYNYFTLVPSGSDLDMARAKLALAQGQLEDAKREWTRLENGPDPNDVAAAQARVDAAQANVNLSRLIAPFAGTVTEADPLVGDQVTPGTSGFRIDNLSHLLVDVQVSEVDINSVQLNQPVVITFDAVPGKDYQGKVTAVASVGSSVQGVVNFTVTVQLDNVDAEVKPGMTAAVTITVKQLDSVILVPNRAVRLVNNQRVVYVLRNGQTTENPITLGATADTFSEVLSGDLKEGDQVILNPPTNFSGARGGGIFGGGG
ncbi:MAG TPA: efflux RND transporter periplasmic adaptor subunit [Anaerolineales bacterium]